MSVSRNTESNRKVRQGNIFRTMMDSYSKSIDLTTIAMHSNGFAMDANAKKLDTTEKKIEELKATITTQWLTLLNSDSFKPLVEGVTSFVKTIGSISNELGVFKTVMATTGLVLFAFNTRFRTFMTGLSIEKVVSFTNTFSLIPRIFSITDVAAQSTTTKMRLLGATLNLTAISANIAKVGMLAFQAALTMGLSVVIGFAIEKLYGLTTAYKDLANSNKELQDSVKENITGNNSNIQQLQSIQDEYEKLSSKTNLTNEEMKRYNEICEQIAGINKEATITYDNQGKAILNMKGNVDDLIKSLKEKNQLENLKLENNGQNQFKEYKNTIDANTGKARTGSAWEDYLNNQNSPQVQKKQLEDLKNQLDEYEKKKEELIKGGKNTTSIDSDIAKVESQIDSLNNKIKKSSIEQDEAFNKLKTNIVAVLQDGSKYNDIFDKMDNATKKLVTDTDFLKNLSKGANSYDEIMQRYKNFLNTISNSDSYKKAQEGMKGLTDTQKQMVNSLMSGFNIDDFAKADANGKNKMDEYYKIMSTIEDEAKKGTPTLEEFKKSLSQFPEAKNLKEEDWKKLFSSISSGAKDSEKSIKDMIQSTDDLQKSLDDNLTKANGYSKMLNEIKNKGIISESSQKEILTKKDYQDLLPFLNDMNGLSEELSKRIDDIKSKSVNMFAVMNVQQEQKSIQDLVDTYNELHSKSNLQDSDKQKLAQTVETLKGKVEGLTTSTDADGKTTIKNIDITNDRIKVLDAEQKYLQLSKEIGEDKAKAAIVAEAAETDSVCKSIQARIDKTKEEFKQKKAIVDADLKAGKIKNDDPEVLAMNELFKKIVEDEVKLDEAANNAVNNLAKKAIDDFNNSQKQSGDIINNLTADTSGQTKATKENTAAVNGAKDAVRNYENALKSLDNTIYELDSKLQGMDDSSQQYRDGLNQEISLLQKKNEILKNGIATNQQYAGSLGNMVGVDTSGSNTGTVSSLYTGSNYRDIINKASQTYGVDANLIAAVIQQESGFRNGETSYAGAQGLMQLMPGTARGLGVTNSFDPEQNIMGGTKYLKQMIDQFGDIRTAVGHYNSGPAGNLTNSQTRDYMVKVMGYYQQFSGGKAIPTVSSGSTGSENSIATEIDSLQSKTEDYQKQIIDNTKKIQELYNARYSSQLKDFDNQIGVKDSAISMAKGNADLFNVGSTEQVQYFTEQSKLLNEKYGVLVAKDQYIQQEMQNNIYDEKTIAEMKKQQLDTRSQEISVVKTLHDSFTEMWTADYKSKTQYVDDNISNLQNKMDILDIVDKNNYQEKFKINNEIIAQEELKAQKIKEQIKLQQDLLDKEKFDSTKTVIKQSIDNLNKDYIDIIKKQNEAKNNAVEMAKSSMNMIDSMESKIAEMIKKNVEEQKQSYDKDLDNFRNAIEEKKNLINEQYNAEDYQRKLAEENQKKQDIQTNINKLSLDSSSEAQAQVIDLRKQLAEQQKNIDDMVRQHNKDEEIKALDQLMSNQEKATQSKKDALDKEYSDEKVNIMAKQALQNGYFKDVKGNIQDLQTAMLTYEDTWGKGLTSIGGMIKSELIDNLTQAKNLISQVPQLEQTINSANSSSNSANNNTSSSVGTMIKGKIFASGADFKNGMDYLQPLGYTMVNISDGKQYTANNGDLILGGEAVTKNVQNNGAKRLGGKDRYETAEKIKAFADELESKGYSYRNGGIITDREQVAVLHGQNANSSFEAVLNEPQLVNLTQNTILDTLQNLDLPSMLSNIQIPSILSNINLPSLPQIQNSNMGGDITLQFDKLINIEGNVDKTVLPSLQQITSNVMTELKSQLNRRGVTRQLGLSW